MARKSRKRRRRRPASAPRAGTAPAGSRREPTAGGAERAARRGGNREGPPPAPWGSFPLAELVVLVGIAMLVVGFVSSGAGQAALIGVGLVLCSLAGLEVAIREHLAGYRSHTLVLAAVPAVATLAALFYFAPAELSPLVRVGAALAVFGACGWALVAAFRRRTGGYAFRIKAPRRR